MNRKVSHPSDQPLGEVVEEEVVLHVVKLLDKAVSLLANPPLVMANSFDLVHLRLVTIQ